MRRLLREHRVNMRHAEDLMYMSGLAGSWDQYLLQVTGDYNFNLEHDPDMDEGSDAPDPEAELRKEAEDRQSFIIATMNLARNHSSGGTGGTGDTAVNERAAALPR